MPLTISQQSERVLFQLRPTDSLFINTKTITIGPRQFLPRSTRCSKAASVGKEQERAGDDGILQTFNFPSSQNAAPERPQQLENAPQAHCELDQGPTVSAKIEAAVNPDITELSPIPDLVSLYKSNEPAVEEDQRQREELQPPPANGRDDGSQNNQKAFGVDVVISSGSQKPEQPISDIQDVLGLPSKEPNMGSRGSMQDSANLEAEEPTQWEIMPFPSKDLDLSSAEIQNDLGQVDVGEPGPKRRKLDADTNISADRNTKDEETQDSLEDIIMVQSVETSHAEGDTSPYHGDTSSKPRPSQEPQGPCVSHDESSEPSIPIERRRSTPRKQKNADSFRILFSTSLSPRSDKNLRSLESKGIKRVASVEECTYFCVGAATDVKKTANLIKAVLLGKEIITYDWVTQSAKSKQLLDPKDFIARNAEREAEWGVDLEEAIERGRQGENRTFLGWEVIFTKAAKQAVGASGFAEIKNVINNAGGKNCHLKLPTREPEPEEKTLIIATAKDPQFADLQVRWRCFTKDMISLSALRGKVDSSSDEFLVSKTVH